MESIRSSDPHVASKRHLSDRFFEESEAGAGGDVEISEKRGASQSSIAEAFWEAPPDLFSEALLSTVMEPESEAMSPQRGASSVLDRFS